MTKVLHISDDMDAATMAKLRSQFDALAESNEDVEINMSNVEFVDSSGIGGIVFLYKRLLANGHQLKVTEVGGQPLRLLRHLRMTGLVGSTSESEAA